MLLDLLPFSFSRPWWLLALLPNLFLCWYLFRHMQKHSGWEALLPANLRKALLQQQQGRRYVGRYLLLGLCWTLALLALSGPAWESDDGIERSDQGALVVVLQVSRSMLSTDLAPNRLDQARRKVQDVMRNFPEKRVALIAYAAKSDALEMDDPNSELVSLPEFGPTFRTGLHYILPIVVLVSVPYTHLTLPTTDSV